MAVRLSRRKIAEYCASELLAGHDQAKLAKILAAYLVDSRRVKELGAIIDDIEYELSLNGVVTANVASAHALDENTRAAIERFIKSKTDAEHINLETEVNAELLGGFRLDFAGLELDTTMANKLKHLRTNL